MKGLKSALAVLIPVIVAAAATSLLVLHPENDEKMLRRDLRATIDFSTQNKGSLPLVVGYNWHLLKRFSYQHASEAFIRLSDDGENSLDSLKSGRTDLVVLPYSDTLKNDPSVLVLSADSTALWVMDPSNLPEARHLAQWLSLLRDRPDYESVRYRYLGFYHPSKHNGQDFISPYDDLVKEYADSLGWDWRLLSAVIFNESHFKIEARSPRGARGLMQVLPAVASRFGCNDLLDPEENIRAGTNIIMSITKKYRTWGSAEEQLKYTLASFNAGPRKVRVCVEHAIEAGIDPSLWNNVADLVPEDPLDTIQREKYLSHETVAYVRHILYLYNRYCTICPEK